MKYCSSEQLSDPATASTPAAHKEDLSAIKQHLKRLRGDLDELTNTFKTTMEQLHAGMGKCIYFIVLRIFTL